MIESFGQFVVGGNYVVGFVLFLALIAIQYLVINHGAVRTAEVAARFTLDALPGKQMAIDADMNAGIIDETQARARRAMIAQEAEFYGAMDGAARFSQRDALATILITAINILAGFLIGVFQLNIPFQDALKTYTILTVGDGLVTMIPSLLVSVAGGLVVTRASSDKTRWDAIGAPTLRARSAPLRIAAGVMFLLALIPGLRSFHSFLLARRCVAGIAARDSDADMPDAAITAAGQKDKKDDRNNSSSRACCSWTNCSLEVGYATGARWSIRDKADNCCSAFAPCDATWPRSLVSWCPRCTSPTTCGSSPANTWWNCAAWRWPAGKCIRIGCWRSVRRRSSRSAGRHRHPRAGLRRGGQVDRSAPAGKSAGLGLRGGRPDLGHRHAPRRTRPAVRASNFSRGRKPSGCWTRWPKRSRNWWTNLCHGADAWAKCKKCLQQLLREQVSIRDLPAILEALLDAAPASNKPCASGGGRAANAGPLRWSSRCWAAIASSRCLRSTLPSRKNSRERSSRCNPAAGRERPQASHRYRAAPCWMVCSASSAIRRRWPRPFCCATARRDFTCAVCSSRFCRVWWCSRRRKFPRASRCNLWGWSR